MVIGSGNAFRDMLMNMKGVCPNCKKEMTFGEAGKLGREHGITDNVVMCPQCNRVFEVQLGGGGMTLTRDVTSRYPQVKPAKRGLFAKLFGK